MEVLWLRMGISPCAGGGPGATLLKSLSLISAGFELGPKITGTKRNGKKPLLKVEPHLLLLCSSTLESRRLQEDFQTSLTYKSVVLEHWNTSGSSENPRHEISKENLLECGARRAGLTPGWHKHVFATVACLCELSKIMWWFQNSIELLHLQLWNLEKDLVFTLF